MSLIVEDGTGITNANTYGTAAGARSYASARGVTLSASDAVVEPMLVNAMDYLNSLTFVGKVVTDGQSLSWPRTCVFYSSGAAYPANTIPSALVDAQYQLVIEQFNGIDILPSTDWKSQGGFVIEDKVDVLTTKFSEKIGTTSRPLMPKVDALLSGLIGASSGRLRTVRI